MILPRPFRGNSRTCLDAQEFPVTEIQYFFMSASLKGPTASQIPLFIVFPSLGSRSMKEWERQNDLNLFLPSWQEFQSMHLSVTASDNGWQLQSHGVVPRACLHESGWMTLISNALSYSQQQIGIRNPASFTSLYHMPLDTPRVCCLPIIAFFLGKPKC